MTEVDNHMTGVDTQEKKYKWTVLSFDIGIKNLAYCILGWIPEEARYEIIKWDDLNLIPDLEDDYCEGILKKSKKNTSGTARCGKKASYLSTTNNKTYCSMHAKPKELFKLIKKRKVSQIKNHELNTLMVKKLDEHPELLNCDEVMLEHQPEFNPRMKNLSFMIYSYFIIRSVDKPDSLFKKISHKQINAVKKLSLYDGPEEKCTLKRPYDRNKYYSKVYCRYMINKDYQITGDENVKKWLEFYDSFKKQDDLADCYLQGAWYLTKQFKPDRIVKKKKPTAVKKKINKIEEIPSVKEEIKVKTKKTIFPAKKTLEENKTNTEEIIGDQDVLDFVRSFKKKQEAGEV